MIVYFDESYAGSNLLMLGALFLPTRRASSWIHREFTKLKQAESFLTKSGEIKELKYNDITTQKKLNLAKRAVDLFVMCGECYFRAGVIPYDDKRVEEIGKQKGIPKKIKKAIVFTKGTTQLFRSSLSNVKNATLLMDDMTRATGDKFDYLIVNQLGPDGQGMFGHVGYVDSKAPSNHTVQICDLLLGAILNENFPASKYKNEFREHVKKAVGLPSLLESYWKPKKAKECENRHPKYVVRYWNFPY